MSPAAVLARTKRRILLPFAVGLNAASIAALLWLDAQESLALKYKGESSDTPFNGGSNKNPDSSKASAEAGLDDATRVREKDLPNADANSNLPVNGVDSSTVKPPAGDTNANFQAHGVPVVGSSAYPQILAGPIPSKLIIHATNDGSFGNKLIADDAAAGSLFISESNWIVPAGAVTNPAGTPQIDTAALTVTSVVTSGSGIDGSGNGDLNAGHVVTLTVNFSEAVTVNTSGGVPTLTLSNGATASYVSGSGTNALVFNYTVGATGSGQDAADLATAAASALTLNGGTIKDAAGNAAVLTGANNVNPAGTLQIDTTAPTVPTIISIALGGAGGNHWVSTGTAEANSTVAIFEGNAQLATVTASVSGSWSYTTTGSVTNSSTCTFTANASDAAGNTSASSAAWIEGTVGNDTFAFASEASLVASGAVNGNGGADTISMMTAVTLNSGDFANVTSVQTLQLTGANTITLGADAAAAGIVNVITGTGVTSITDSNGVTLNVDATALADNVALTLAGSAAESVTGLQGDLTATGVSGALNVTTVAVASGLSIATGSGSNTITATALTAGQTLTLTGSSAATVTLNAGASSGNLAAGTYTGNLTVTGGTGANTITVGNGTNTITGGGGADILTGGTGSDTFNFGSAVNLGAATTIAGGAGNDTIQMTAAATLTDANFLHASSVETLGLTGASTITLGANAASAGIVNVITGTGATSITDSNGVTLNVDATALANNTALTLVGSAAEVIAGLIGDITAGSLTGALTVTTGDATDNTISITTGSAATSITDSFNTDTVTVNATALANNIALTLARLCGGGGDRADRQHHGWFSDRRTDGDNRGCHRQHHIDHDRFGSDLDHRQLQHRYRDGDRDRVSAEYGFDARRLGGGGGDRTGRGYRRWLSDRRADGDDRGCG